MKLEQKQNSWASHLKETKTSYKMAQNYISATHFY